MNKGSDPRVRTSACVGGTHLGLRRNAPPFAGRCGNRRPQRWFVPRSRGASRPVRAERARGSASRSSARTTNEVRGTDSRRGFARPNDGRTFGSSRSGPAARSLRRHALRGSSARCRPLAQAKGRTKVKAGRGSSPPLRRTRKPCCSRRCPCIVVLQKSAERPRAQRSAPPVTAGSKASSPQRSA